MSEPRTEVDHQIGARIQRKRERAGISRAELAGQLRLSETDLEAIEAGQTRPRPDVLLDLANTLNVPLTELMKPDQR